MILAQGVPQIFCSQGPLWVKCLSLKRGIIQSNIDRILWIVNQVIYIMYLNCVSDIMISAQTVLQTFCSQGWGVTTQNAEVGKGRKFSQIFTEFCQSKSGHLHLGHNLWTKYHDPSSSGSLGILGPLWVKRLSLKRGIIQSNFDRILWIVRWST